ncbi:MAG TPA: hypothetical protein VKK79_19930 [Candidatus Lokiarchaeia archaeon]|nr:hypothetical protein [Candidatus Lokiarchaeia archaeon]
MSTESQSYLSYLRHSVGDIFKAIVLGVLLFGGILVAIILRFDNFDGMTVFILGVIVQSVMFVVIFLLSKKGFLYVLQRQEDFELHGPKKTKKRTSV